MRARLDRPQLSDGHQRMPDWQRVLERDLHEHAWKLRVQLRAGLEWPDLPEPRVSADEVPKIGSSEGGFSPPSTRATEPAFGGVGCDGPVRVAQSSGLSENNPLSVVRLSRRARRAERCVR